MSQQDTATRFPLARPGRLGAFRCISFHYGFVGRIQVRSEQHIHMQNALQRLDLEL